MSDAEEDNQEHELLGKLGLRDFALWMSQSEHPIRMSLRRFAAAVDVESVVQETFLRVWSNSAQIRGDRRPHPPRQRKP
jgi:DNA-directed RNA polymerase specialized sigma24 family protein